MSERGAGKSVRIDPPAIDWQAWIDAEAAALRAIGFGAATARAEAEKSCGRQRMRIEWARERWNAFFEMQDRAGEAYMAQIEAHPDVDWEDSDAPELPEPPEEAIAQAIYAEVRAAMDEDKWPRHLHWHWV